MTSFLPSSPIALFDSGIGGLTVLSELRKQFPHENFIYLGDTARLPYGAKSSETIRKYLLQNIRYLVQAGAKAIVIACNSASSAMLSLKPEDQIKFRAQFDLPIYNVIEPGARLAAQSSSSGRIGLIGTRATVDAGSYPQLIKKIRPEAMIWSQACPLLVPLVEEGLEDDPITNLIVFRYLQPLKSHAIDALIMGCTHYPLLKKAFAKVLGSQTILIDSSCAIGDWIRSDMQEGLLAKAVPTENHGKRLRLLVTDTSQAFFTTAKRLCEDEQIPELEWVDLVLGPDLK